MDVVIDFLYLSRLTRRRSGRCGDAKNVYTSELDKEFAEHCNVGWGKPCGVFSELNGSGLIRFKFERVWRERIIGCLARHELSYIYYWSWATVTPRKEGRGDFPINSLYSRSIGPSRVTSASAYSNIVHNRTSDSGAGPSRWPTGRFKFRATLKSTLKSYLNPNPFDVFSFRYIKNLKT